MIPYSNKYSSSLALQYQDLIKPHFKNGDFAITFTFDPAHRIPILNSKLDSISCSNDVYHYLNVINRGFYGHQYRSGKIRLKSASFFELSLIQNIHVHMVVENPIKHCRIEPEYRMKFLHTAWLDMKCSKEPKANLIKEIKDVDGWINYITKDIRSSTTVMADIQNWHFAPAKLKLLQLNM